MPKHVDWRVFLACTIGGEGINVKTFVALHTTISFEGLYDLLELSDVYQSWQEAARLNAQEEHGK